MNNPTPTPGYLDRVEAHLRKAVEKHPHFADRMTYFAKCDTQKFLVEEREMIRARIKMRKIDAYALLNCEVMEALDAYASGDYAHAADECYDAIAVLLRMAFWLDGMATEKKGESK